MDERKVFTTVKRKRIKRLYPDENDFEIAKEQIDRLKGKADRMIIDSCYHELV